MGWEQRSARQLCAANLRRTLIVYQNSARQMCAANLRRTLCTRTVRHNCALQTCSAHCVPVQCATTVHCKLAVHIVYQNSARQSCAANLGRTMCARTVRQKSNLHTKNVFAANLPQLCAANLPQVCSKFAAYMYQKPYILVRGTTCTSIITEQIRFMILYFFILSFVLAAWEVLH